MLETIQIVLLVKEGFFYTRRRVLKICKVMETLDAYFSPLKFQTFNWLLTDVGLGKIFHSSNLVFLFGERKRQLHQV